MAGEVLVSVPLTGLANGDGPVWNSGTGTWDTTAVVDFGAATGAVTIAGQSYTTTVDAKGTLVTKEPVNVGTTDATVTTLDSFTLASNTAVTWSVTVTAVKSGMTQAAGYSRTATFRNNAGTVTQVGATQDGYTVEDDAAWDVTIDNSTTTIRCRVTGVAATNIRWTCVSSRLEVVY
jgi:hypothetical protein